MSEKISPGVHPAADFSIEAAVAHFGLAHERFGRVESLKSTVYVGGAHVVKVFPDSVPAERLELAAATARANRQSLGRTQPTVAIPTYRRTLSGDVVAVVDGHPVVAMEKLPGQPPERLSTRYIVDLATAHANVHRSFRHPELLQRSHGQRLSDVASYITTFMQPGLSLPEQVEPAVNAVDANWSTLPAGVVPMDFWSGNTLADAKGRLTGIIDWDDSIYGPRLLCLGMALWGIYAMTNGNADAVTSYVNVYDQAAQLTEMERVLWPDMVTARAATSWYGAKLVSEEAAAGDLRRIEQWVAYRAELPGA